ncbi:hypothetical protein [Xanthomonas bundabergensis]
MAAADAHAAIRSTAGGGRLAARRGANVAQYRLTPGLNISSPH